MTSIQGQHSLTLGQTASLFVSSFFEPLVDLKNTAASFCQEQLIEAQNLGIARYTWIILYGAGKAIKDHPLETLSLASNVAAGKVNPLIINALNQMQNVQFAKKLIASKSFSPTIQKLTTIVSYGAIGYLVSSIPAAAALEWNTLADAKAHYNGGMCPSNPWDTYMKPVADCIGKENGLQECRPLVSEKVEIDSFVFTKHFSSNQETDPVSVINFGKKETCFYTLLSKTSGVTKTCFPDLNQPNIRTVEQLQEIPLAKAHEGLDQGQSVIHIGMHYEKKGCGFFHNTEANTKLESPICLLTSLNPEGPVTQMCFDAKHPEAMTLKKIEGLKLAHQDNNPASILIENPKAFNLDTAPDKPSSCPADAKHFSLWDALSWWWNQKTPCEQAQEKAREL